MQEVKKTPEQEEMEVYEEYLKAIGPDHAINVLIRELHEAEKCFGATAALAAIKDGPLEEPSIKAWVRRKVAKLQVHLNVMELLVGDTAEEACEEICHMAESIYAMKNIR